MSTTVQEPEMLVVGQVDDTGLEARTRGEIDVQIATAKRYPRSIRQFRDTAMEAATLDEETAASCIYAVPRDNKTVEGPSARLAEIVASAWGHLRIEARGIGEDDRFVTSRAVAWDLQNNVAVGFEVKRRVTTRKGQKYSDDMIVTTTNAASSIALRNAVFKVVPSPFWRPIYHACRQVAVGDAKTLADRRHASIQAFGKMGVRPEQIFTLLGVKGEEDITLDHLGTLRGLFTAIKDGETSIDEAFAAPTTQEPKKPGLDHLTEQLKPPTGSPAPVMRPSEDTPATSAAPSPAADAPSPARVTTRARLVEE